MVRPSLFLLAWAAAHAVAQCTRDMLKSATSSYLAALAAGDASKLRLAKPATYAENNRAVDIAKGVLGKPVTIDFRRTFHDTAACAAFAEVVAATNNNPHPYVIHTQIRVVAAADGGGGGAIAAVDSVVTEPGDWVFNATAFLEWDRTEKWDPIPEAARDSRDVIRAAVDAYLDNWAKPDLPVPHGTPCARLEGGVYTGAGKLDKNTCDMGAFPEPLNVTNRRYVVDEMYGVVDVINDFPWLEITLKAGEATASSNLLRVENGKVRYIHEITECLTESCGRLMPPPAV
jgi:hypothetical protein